VIISFLSDFGLEDDFVGVCHGVIKHIAPETEVIDLSHGIAPQNVLQGALVLRSTLPYMPVGVHLAVVDPGVGGDRRAVALRSGGGRLFVGPDNGLLVLAAEQDDGIAAAHELRNEAYRLEDVSRTFHGRDLFAPAAAHLSTGTGIEDLGPALDPATLVRIELPEPAVGSSRIRAEVLYVDRFGNVQLNLERTQLEQVDIVPGSRVELVLPLESYYAVAARTFAEAGHGQLILYEDAYGSIAVALTDGDAASMLGTKPGDPVEIRTAGE
jgi:S-adenosyl-L-methionine hydrolase (adenosine-forming)